MLGIRKAQGIWCALTDLHDVSVAQPLQREYKTPCKRCVESGAECVYRTDVRCMLCASRGRKCEHPDRESWNLSGIGPNELIAMVLTRWHEVEVAAVPKRKCNESVVEDASRWERAVVASSAPPVMEGLCALHMPSTTSLLPEKRAWLEPGVLRPVMPGGSLLGALWVTGQSGYQVPPSSGPSEVGGSEQGRFDATEQASLDHQICQAHLAQRRAICEYQGLLDDWMDLYGEEWPGARG